jgi:hypothetical protein
MHTRAAGCGRLTDGISHISAAPSGHLLRRRLAPGTIRLMQRITILAAVLASGGLLASCGGHGALTSGVRTHSTEAPADPAAPKLTSAQAVAFAHRVNLRAADVPGFRHSAEHEHETNAEKRLGREMLRCVGAAGARHGLADASSTGFEHKGSASVLTVSSNVTVARTPAIATKELSELRSGHTRGCVAHYFSQVLRGQQFRGGTVSPVSIMHGDPPAAGTTGSFGWRISAAVTVNLPRGPIHRIRLPFYIDILGFVYGRAEVALFSFGTPLPFPAAAEQHLFTLLLNRAQARGV